MSTSLDPARNEQPDRLGWWALGVGVVCLVVCAIGALFSPAQFFRAYLAAYQFYLGLGLGSLVIVMIYHLTGGAWGFLVRRTLEAGMRTLPLLALLFLPIAGGLGYLYVWARPEEVAASKELQHKEIYLNVPFFWFRAALFFFLWWVFAFVLNIWSRRQDQTGDPRLVRRLGGLSAPGLVIYGITITFASVDWVMSLQPTFHSTIFGPLYASGQMLSAFCVAVLVLARVATRPPVADFVSREALNDVGNMLLTFLVVWAYMVFFQFLLIWIANLPYEVLWYLPRSRGGWYWVAWALVVLHLAVPFFLLLLREVKRDPPTLARVAGLILFMQLVFVYYQVLPAFPNTRLYEHWMDFLTPLGVGGLWLAAFLRELKRRPLLPVHDPNQEAAAHLHASNLEEDQEEEEFESD